MSNDPAVPPLVFSGTEIKRIGTDAQHVVTVTGGSGGSGGHTATLNITFGLRVRESG